MFWNVDDSLSNNFPLFNIKALGGMVEPYEERKKDRNYYLSGNTVLSLDKAYLE